MVHHAHKLIKMQAIAFTGFFLYETARLLRKSMNFHAECDQGLSFPIHQTTRDQKVSLQMNDRVLPIKKRVISLLFYNIV